MGKITPNAVHPFQAVTMAGFDRYLLSALFLDGGHSVQLFEELFAIYAVYLACLLDAFTAGSGTAEAMHSYSVEQRSELRELVEYFAD